MLPEQDGQLSGEPVRSLAIKCSACAGLYVAGRGLRMTPPNSKPTYFWGRPVLKTNHPGTHIQVASNKRDTVLGAHSWCPTHPGWRPKQQLQFFATGPCYAWPQRSVGVNPGNPELGSAVDDVALGVEREFFFQSADSARPRNDPRRSEFSPMCGRGRFHHEFLEAVLEAAGARMTPSDSFSARLINWSRQRLLFFRVLGIHGAGTQRALRF